MPVENEEATAASGELSAAPGSLDPSFAARCVDTSARFTVASGVYAMFQNDGKIITAASVIPSGLAAWEFGLVRFLADGSLDTSFGSGGFVHTSWGVETVTASVEGMALTSDGKIVVVGSRDYTVVDAAGVRSQPTVIAVARYLSNGALDKTFGNGGLAQTAVLGKADRANAVLVQSDGKILVGGSARQKIPGYTATNVTALVRFNTSGTLDSSFGTGGIVTTTGPGVETMGLEQNGNILVSPPIQRFAANGAVITAPFTGTLVSTTKADFSSMQLLANGGRVSAGSVRSAGSKHAHIPTVIRFDVAGNAQLQTPGFNFGSSVLNVSATLEALLVEPSGRIIAGGIAPLPNAEYGFGLAAVTPTGTIDSAFGGPQGLFTRITSSSSVTALLQQPDSKILALGGCESGIGIARYIGP